MNILIISSSEGITLSILRCLGLLKLNPYLINIWKSSSSSRFSRFCKNYTSYHLSESSSAKEVEQIVRNINGYCQQKKIDVIIPAGLLGTFLVAKVKEKLTSANVFPLTSAEKIYNLHNKWDFYKFLLEEKIPVPETIFIEREEQINSLKLDFPVIVKPLDLGNGEGVKKIDSLEEIKEYIYNKKVENELPLLIQEYIPGLDIILGVLAENGKILAWGTYRRTPDFLEFRKNDAIMDIAHKIVSSCNYTGVACFDIRLDERDSSLKVLECNPRFWASFAGLVYYGVDFVKMGILLAQGSQLPENLKKEVTSTEPKYIAYPWPNNFIKGLISGKYPLNSIQKFQTDLAWQSLLDPLPNLYEKVWNRLGILNTYDGIMLDKL